MKIYRVGGVVRDAVMGRKPADCDYVVVGGTSQAMLDRGYKEVGADFPVFIDPTTGDEYALARTERKTGPGYKGFSYATENVTLEEDLSRRDFTINAMAQPEDGGEIVDPYHGRRDISLRLLRHVSPAFGEDPLRVLRAARIAAQLGFTIVPQTMELMKEMTAAGALEELPAERVWQELKRGLMCGSPGRMIEIWRECGALQRILPEVDALFGVEQAAKSHPEGCAGTHTLLVLRVAALNWWPLEVRWAALLHDVGKALTPKEKLPHHPGHEISGVELVRGICARLKVPRKAARSAEIATREHGVVHGFDKLTAEQMVDFFNRVGFNDEEKIKLLLGLADCDHAAHPGVSNYELHPNRGLIMQCRSWALAAEIPEMTEDKKGSMKEIVHGLRVQQIQQNLS